MKVPLLVLGGGLSGLAAAIRAARFIPEVLLIEKHTRLGGLNSYFYRNNRLLETGLHAITNYAEPGNKQAPLNRLLRQLKVHRSDLSFCQQFHSEIIFKSCENLCFSNDFRLLEDQICSKFPNSADGFQRLLRFLKDSDPFVSSPFRSTRLFLNENLKDPLLVEMLLCPLMFYGSSYENDMDLNQFAIMFGAIFLEGMFRPKGTIKDLLDYFISHFLELGGNLRKGCGAKRIIIRNNRAVGVELDDGELLECDYLLSTIGHHETLRLMSEDNISAQHSPRLGFVESIFLVEPKAPSNLPKDKTIIFFNNSDRFSYQSPDDFVDLTSGVICFPENFHGIPTKDSTEIRSTHLASYSRWKNLASSPDDYLAKKLATSSKSVQAIEKLIGSFAPNIVYRNTFTPVTIERYTSKISGAIYGSPFKIKDGNIGYANLFLAGTDQGFLGIIGSMLSGVSIVNQHILPKL